MSHLYNSQLLYRLFKVNPKHTIKFFPEIATQELYDFCYEMIINYPEIINNYKAETKKVFENIILNEKQYYTLIQLLETENHELISVIENRREKLKQEYYKKLLNSQKSEIEHEWFHSNKFRYTFDLFNNSELLEIIKKIVELEINHSHYTENNNRNVWANLVLLEIGWKGKNELFTDSLEKLTHLGYLQVVRRYFYQFPERIKDSKKLIFEKLGSFGIELLEKHYKEFEIDDPVKIFGDLISKNYYTERIVDIFFKNHQELISNFIEVIKKYFQLISSSDSNNIKVIAYYKITNFLRIIYTKYPTYLAEFDENLIQLVFQKFLSIPDIAEQFHPLDVLYLPKKFNLFEEEFQKNLMTNLIENKKLSSIEFFLIRNFQNFNGYLEDIIEFQPKESLQSEHFIRILELIVKKKYDDSNLKRKIIDQLDNLEDCSRKAQLYSFLGELNLSKQVLKRMLENELMIPYVINTFLDYKLVNLEIFTQTSKIINFSDDFKEIIECKNDFEDFNSEQSVCQNFLFKLSCYKARLYFYIGFQYLKDGIYNKSENAFRQSTILYNRLRVTKVIKDNTKKIFDIYARISDFFQLHIPSIKVGLKNGEYKRINFMIQRHLSEILEEFPQSNIQFKRILKSVNKIKFDLNSTFIDQFRCEIPTNFCPKPPLILKKSLLDENDKICIKWDKDNNPSSIEPIEISSGWKKYYIELEFAEKKRFFDFNLELRENSFFKITEKEKITQAGIIRFGFMLNFDKFYGVQKLLFKITEDDICGFELKFFLFIIHKASKEEISIKIDDIPDFNLLFMKYEGTIEDLAKEFVHFEHKNGKNIDKKTIKEWLIQFNTPYKAYLALKILQKITFISRSLITSVIKELLNDIKEEKNEIIVSPLGGPADSSSHITYYFRDLNLTDEIKEIPLRAIIDRKNPKETTILFLDDIIQTGDQVISIFQQLLGISSKLNETHEVKLKRKQIKKFKKFKLLFFFIIGLRDNESNLIEKLNGMGFSNIEIHSYYKEVRYTSCFHSTSGVFKEPEERRIALDMCKEIGFQLFEDKSHWFDEKKRKNSLGYGNAQKLIVFPYNVPTTTLPILWKSGKYNGKEWIPLFIRREKK